jgi:asparagine synthase (glutamine-hydrolysing)
LPLAHFLKADAMKAFFAMCWNTADARSAEQAEQIKEWANLTTVRPDTQRTGPGLLFLNLSDAPASEDVIELRDEPGLLSGIVFGRLFVRGDDTARSPPVSGLRADKAVRVIRSSGEELFNRYWGSYAAIGVHDGKPWAVSDPLSSVPCFFRTESGVLLVFSHLERCPFLRNVRYTLNRDFISLILHYDKLQTGETCFQEIRELMGGERLIASGSVARTELLWDPRRIAAQTSRLAVAEAAELLGETTKASVASWAGLFDRVRLNLSGGLDSSIVAACLSACCPPDKIELVHQVMESTDQS